MGSLKQHVGWNIWNGDNFAQGKTYISFQLFKDCWQLWNFKKLLKIRFTPKGFLKILTFSPSIICIAVRERVLIFYSILKYMYSSF